MRVIILDASRAVLQVRAEWPSSFRGYLGWVGGGDSAGVGEYKKCSNVVWLRRVSRARSDGIMNMHRRIGGAPEDDEVVNR